jgi:hypothetical protein
MHCTPVIRYYDTAVTLLDITPPDPAAVLLFLNFAQDAFFKAYLVLTRVQVFGVAAWRGVASMQDPQSFRNGSHPQFVG